MTTGRLSAEGAKLGAILLNIGYMPARFGGITHHELERDSDKAQALHMSLTLHLP